MIDLLCQLLRASEIKGDGDTRVGLLELLPNLIEGICELGGSKYIQGDLGGSVGTAAVRATAAAGAQNTDDEQEKREDGKPVDAGKTLHRTLFPFLHTGELHWNWTGLAEDALSIPLPYIVLFLTDWIFIQ